MWRQGEVCVPVMGIKQKYWAFQAKLSRSHLGQNLVMSLGSTLPRIAVLNIHSAIELFTNQSLTIILTRCSGNTTPGKCCLHYDPSIVLLDLWLSIITRDLASPMHDEKFSESWDQTMFKYKLFKKTSSKRSQWWQTVLPSVFAFFSLIFRVVQKSLKWPLCHAGKERHNIRIMNA